MAQNDKLYIIITDKRGETTPTPSPTPTPTNDSANNDDQDVLLRYAEHHLFHVAKESINKGANFVINNIGNITGDYISQRGVNEARQLASGLTSIAMTTLAGAKIGGEVGAIIGFATGTISALSDAYFEYAQKTINTAKTNLEINELRSRAGLNTIYDGSRGTEN
jgi:hypothetical protein